MWCVTSCRGARLQSGESEKDTCKQQNKMDVDNDLQCPICLELYRHPLILPCSHVLCKSPCAEHLFDSNFIKCPVCRDNCYISGGLPSLPRVLALENIIERYKEEQRRPVPVSSFLNETRGSDCKSSLCHLCESKPRRAKRTCITCQVSYCGPCLKISHPNKEPFIRHKLIDPQRHYKKLDVRKCIDHDEDLDLFCFDCKTVCCKVCVQDCDHANHKRGRVTEVSNLFRADVQKALSKMDVQLDMVSSMVQEQKEQIKHFQQAVQKRRDDINCQCDSIVAEVENKRSYFLADLDYEERVHQCEMEDVLMSLEKVHMSSQTLRAHAVENLSTDPATFLQVGPDLNSRLQKASEDCDSCQVSAFDFGNIQNKVVDSRKERAAIRDMYYLQSPNTPVIDVEKCTRSEDSVVLVLQAAHSSDVVDEYEVNFCSEEQKSLGIDESAVFRNFDEQRQLVKTSNSESCQLFVLLIENLCRATSYYFCVSASNYTCKSSNSEVVQCTTVNVGESVIPVPVILEALCTPSVSSIQIYSTSPTEVAIEQQISHYLVYRPATLGFLWKCIPIYGRQEHKVFGLEASSEYEFAILATNTSGECQISNKVILHTEAHIS